jgi:hypothetical protein
MQRIAKSASRILIFALGLGFYCAVLHAADGVFAVSATYSIRPDGVCQELVGGNFGELEKKNSHWDAATKTVKLVAAKNEEAAVQLVIPVSGKNFSGSMSDLKGKGSIKSDRASFSALIWAKGSNGNESPDLVIPLDGSIKDMKAFDIPVSFTGLPSVNNKIGSMLFEVWVPEDAAAGIYKGTVSVMQGSKEFEKLNLELTVLDFKLPAMPNFAMDLLDYDMPSIPLGYKEVINGNGLNVKANMISSDAKKTNYQVYKLAADNRCFLNIMTYHSQRGNPKFAAPIAGKGASAKVMSWTEFDDFFAPILDGKQNKYGEPPAHFTMPFNINYPHICEGDPEKQFAWEPFESSIPSGPGSNGQLKEFEDTNRVIAKAYIDHFAEKGWTKTRFEIYHNQKGEGKKKRKGGARNRIGSWSLDEPTAKNDYAALQYLYNVAHWAFKDAAAKKIQVVTRNDIGHWHCDKFQTPDGGATKDFKSKAYDKADAAKYLKNTTDHWVIGLIHGEAAQHLLKGYEAPGKKMMIYASSGATGLNTHFGQYSGITIRMARMGIVGVVLYKIGLPISNPNSSGKGKDTDHLLYNGKDSIGFDGAIPSRRLKLWRDSVNIYDYIAAARVKNAGAVDTLLNKMVKVGLNANKDYREQSKARGFWINNNVEDYNTFKLNLAELITGAKLGAEKIEGFSKKYTPCGSEDKITDYD